MQANSTGIQEIANSARKKVQNVQKMARFCI